MENTQSTKPSWDQVKAALKEGFSTISEKELDSFKGKEEKLHKYLQNKLGKNRAEVDQILEKVHSSLKEKLQEKSK
jgi:uncharacterized protein YjbJ (UPF0337 family)